MERIDVTPFFRDALGRLEEKRARVGGEVNPNKTELKATYTDIERKARALHAIAEMALEEHPCNVDYVLASAGAANMVAGVNESMALHALETDEEKTDALGQAQKWTRKLDDHKDILGNTHRTLHGPTVWFAEKSRSLAKIAERKPNATKFDRLASLGYSQLAVHEGKQLLMEAEVSKDPNLISAAKSVAGTAMVEVARTLDTILHTDNGNVSEETEADVLHRFQRGRSLVWGTRGEIPNYDRIYAAEARTFNHLLSHKTAITHSAFVETFKHMAILAKESPMIAERVRSRLKNAVKRFC